MTTIMRDPEFTPLFKTVIIGCIVVMVIVLIYKVTL